MKTLGLYIILQIICVLFWAIIYTFDKPAEISHGEVIIMGMLQGGFLYKVLKDK